MPLIHSKKPSAFKENIRKEVHAGKPVKQAVAIAYSVKRKAEHKADGGMCMACGGMPCKMAKGGEVQEKDYKLSGINQQGSKEDNVSELGEAIRAHKSAKFQDEADEAKSDAKDIHRTTMTGMKYIKPKLKGLAEGGPVLPGAQSFQDSFRQATHKADGGEVEPSEDNEMHEMIGPEMMDAVHSKDHKKLMGCIEAMVLHHMSKKGE